MIGKIEEYDEDNNIIKYSGLKEIAKHIQVDNLFKILYIILLNNDISKKLGIPYTFEDEYLQYLIYLKEIYLFDRTLYNLLIQNKAYKQRYNFNYFDQNINLNIFPTLWLYRDIKDGKIDVSDIFYYLYYFENLYDIFDYLNNNYKLIMSRNKFYGSLQLVHIFVLNFILFLIENYANLLGINEDTFMPRYFSDIQQSRISIKILEKVFEGTPNNNDYTSKLINEIDSSSSKLKRYNYKEILEFLLSQKQRFSQEVNSKINLLYKNIYIKNDLKY